MKKLKGVETVADYMRVQKGEHGAVCKLLRKELNATIPKAKSKMYHGLPVWFVGENAVVGFHVHTKKGVTLLFWNGQNLGEPELKAMGKFEAAQIQFHEKNEIKLKDLRRWFKKAGKNIWDFSSLKKS